MDTTREKVKITMKKFDTQQLDLEVKMKTLCKINDTLGWNGKQMFRGKQNYEK